MIPRNVPYEHNPPRRDNIVTVVMPGITSCRSQLSRYTGGDPLQVLCNWSDVDPTDPLHIADAGGNRFTGMSLAKRLRLALQQWRSVVMGWKSDRSESDEDDDVVDAPQRTSPDVVRGGASVSLSVASRTSPSSFGAAVQAADLGLIDPPVLYSATCRIAPRLLHGVLASPEVAEVRHCGWYRTINPMHWVLTVKELITCWSFSVRPFQWCFSEPGRTNTAGIRDQAAFTREVRRAVRHIKAAPTAEPHNNRTDVEARESTSTTINKKHLVLFGVSRGATTCFYSAMKLAPEEAKHVSLVLVEAPFDTLDHVIDTSCWVPCLMRWFVRSFSDWRGNQEERLAYDFDPQKVHLRCPVAFVMSVKDTRVPISCTQALIDRVQRELVPHVIPAVEVLVLKNSRHATMAVGSKEDQDAYVAFVERLYNTYCSP
ncbi:conserved hypothetical protein [Leishmania braziliensis MHOM/BR/75/M2904]|uniref:Uncharacterized protein n=2 Tax=Leishmania braziliensis TaxID=5660 RepID=A4HLF9_LEIBR|nr:conserved hypothetical protein [Leishmania braziliensis MHOM/BR/75/M2904]CAJ2479401.1 unnamed protein product [Leishmania braziliensis]CAJ2479781.1 unnamed protein product [Leishmania braziliensis]CAM40655.1 conserved hypothetical protein [Leishmania braziliensis MHOM/BR/75/M2904]SYZ69066.1 hypothetical_protein [Leishmania braziliensis MHOM/BR/75/M2904]